MREMKNSGVAWIGNIPDSWEVKPIRHFLDERIEKNSNQQVKAILSLSAKEGVTLYNGENHSGNKPREDLSDYKIVRKNDIVANSMNILSGSVGLSDYLGVVSPVYYVYYNRDSNVNNLYYLYYLFQCKEFQRGLWGLGNGILVKESESGSLNTIRTRIPSKRLRMQLFPSCSKKEQDQIVIALDKNTKKIDILISNQEQQIEKLKQYKQSLITEVVTKGLNPDVPMKDSGVDWIGSIPINWKIIKLKYITDVSRGLFNHRPRNDSRLYDGKYPFIQTGDVARAKKYITTYSQTLNENGASVSKLFPKGTMTMTIAANVGDIAILGFDAYFPDSVVGFTVEKGFNENYVYYLFKSLKESFIRASIVSTQLNLNIERSKEILVPVTYAKHEQQQIATYLDNKCAKIDRLIAIKQEKINKLNDYKKSLIYEYVTGKKEA